MENNTKARGALLISCFLLFISIPRTQAQVLSSGEDGVKITKKGSLQITYDEFTGEIDISVIDTLRLSKFYKESGDQKSFVTPMYARNGSYFIDNSKEANNFSLTIINVGYEKHLSDQTGSIPVLYVMDGQRGQIKASYSKAEEKNSNSEKLTIKFSESEWEQIIESDITKFRIEKQVFFIDGNTKDLMSEIFKEYKAVQSDFLSKHETETSDKKTSSPFDLNVEGIDRNPLVQPLPENANNYEATITIRFEVRPNGSVTNLIPIRKSGSPEVDREVIKTLSNWRFSRLPSDAPQQSQVGTITFRFVKD